MNTTPLIVTASLLLTLTLTLVGSGCGMIPVKYTLTDVSSNQPWAGPSEKARLRTGVSANFVRVSYLSFWKYDGRIYPAKLTAGRAYYFRDKFPDAPTETHVRRRGQKTSQFSHSTAIVCVDPIIVVESPIVHERPDASFHYDEDGLLGWRFSRTHIILQHGYSYGKRIPYHPDSIWWSPDLEIGPTPLSISPEGDPFIPVEWGRLTFKRKGDIWIVGTAKE